MTRFVYPINVTPNSAAALCNCANISSTKLTGEPSGRNNVDMNHRGVPPVTAMSLAFTCNTYQPIRSVAKVIGSIFATR